MLAKAITKILVQLVAFYLRHSPWERGRWRLLRWAFSHSRLVLAAGGGRVIRTRLGYPMRVNLGDWDGMHIYISGEHEPGTTRVLQSLLQPGDMVIDVGANVGYFTLLASRSVGNSGKIHSYEPVPRTRQRLFDNLRLNGVENVQVCEEAVCDRQGEVDLHSGPDHHSGLASLRPLDNASTTVRVRTGRLDDLLAGERVSLAKIDVEGAECQVIDGMAECLRQQHPDVIVEVTDKFLQTMGHSATMLCTQLTSLGYRMYLIDDDGLVPLTLDTTGLPEQFNAFFTVRPSLPADIPIKEHWSV